MTDININTAPAAAPTFTGSPQDWEAGVYQRQDSDRTIVVDTSGDWIMFNATSRGGFKTGLTNHNVNGVYEQVSDIGGTISSVTLP